MPDPFSRKTYLHSVPDDTLPVRFSLGKRTRALQLQAFFKFLEAAAGPRPGDVRLELIVLGASDWRQLLSAPYGWGLTRRTEAGVSVALPAAYPPRLIARWDAVRLRAAQAGVRAPGGVAAFLDAYLGLEWAHARLLGQTEGKRPPAWRRELSACYLYQQVLWRARDTHKLEYLHAWARLQQAGAPPPAPARLPVDGVQDDLLEDNLQDKLRDDPLHKELPHDPKRFVYPRAKLPLPQLLAAQSALWLQAAALTEEVGWDLTPNEVQTRLLT